MTKVSVMRNQRHLMVNARLRNQGVGGLGLVPLYFDKPAQVASALPITILDFKQLSLRQKVRQHGGSKRIAEDFRDHNGRKSQIARLQGKRQAITAFSGFAFQEG